MFVWQVKREWQAGVIDQSFYSNLQTFLTYTILRLVTQGIGINSGFALFDAISLEYAKLHGGQYSMIFFSKSIVEPIVTALSGFLVVHSSDKNGKQVSSFLISERLYFDW